MYRSSLVASTVLIACAAGAHPGGVNADGCHIDKKTGEQHCHKGKTASADATKRPEQPQPSNPGGSKCYTGPRGGTYTITPSGKKNYGGC